MVARVLERSLREELLLDHPRAGEATQNVRAARLVVRPARARAAERLLPDQRGRRLAV